MKTKTSVLLTLIILLLLTIFTSIVPASSVANIEKAGKRSDGRIKYKVTCSSGFTDYIYYNDSNGCFMRNSSWSCDYLTGDLYRAAKLLCNNH